MLETLSRLRVADVQLEMLARGDASGETVLFLHDLDYLNGVDYPFVEALSERWRLLSPSHPGFGESSLPDDFDSIDDLAFVYLDLLREIGPAHVIGAGFGGWLAAEVAVRSTEHVRSLVLVDALGIKVSDRTTPDIKDMFVVSPSELVTLCWHDIGKTNMPLPSPRFDEDTLTRLLNNRRTAALVGWKPFMHDPKLLGRLRRINRPTLVVWGASDGLVTPDYGRAYAAAIPASRFALLESAGHYPYLEQPDAFVSVVEPFLSSSRGAVTT